MAWGERLKSGRYRGGYRDAFGAKHYTDETYTHKAQAVREAAALEKDSRDKMRRSPANRKQTWGTWADTWWASRSVEDSTERTDRSRRARHLDPWWESVPLGAITRQDVKDWAADLRRGDDAADPPRKPLGPETVKRCVHLLSASLAAAVDKELLDVNPAAKIKLPGGPPADERYLTDEEYVAIRGHLPTETDQLIADLLVHTGIRWGELAGLHAARVDLKRGMLLVVETYDERSVSIKAYPKGKRKRNVPLTPELVKALRKRILTGKVSREDCGIPHKAGRCPGPLLVTTLRGEGLRNTNWAARAWRPAVERSGVGHVRIHDLRHTYASWLLQEGVSLAEVGSLLGHVSPITTQRYAHLATEPSAAVLAALKAARAKPKRKAGPKAGTA